MLGHDNLTTPPTLDFEALADEIATFGARVDVAEHALLTRLRTFDAHQGLASGGFLSCAHWLSWRVGVGLEATRERVKEGSGLSPALAGVARALADLPRGRRPVWPR